MKNILSKGQLSILVVLTFLILDQVFKILVKTNMYYGEAIYITDWFHIRFIENNGIAFGIQIIPKVIQTVFRIIIASLMIWYVTIIIKDRYKYGYVICISLILAGAWGNIIDSVFYGVIFSESTPFQIASHVPLGDGYSNFLHGKVVDMFSFPFFEFNWPNWLPYFGGANFTFFGPIFNIADAAVFCGTVTLILFYRKDLEKSMIFTRKKKTPNPHLSP